MQDRVVKCLELMNDLISISAANVGNALAAASSSMPYSPNGVLDAAACLSFKSDERTTPSHTNKRRKLVQQTPLNGAN